jgi:PAS domain S-box-containing protein
LTAGGAAVDGRSPPDDELRAILDAVPALVAYIDEGQRYRFCSHAYERWFGADVSTVLGRHVRDVLGEAAYATIEPHIRAALAGRFVAFEARVPYRDGGARWVEAAYAPRVDPDGRVRGFVSLVHDVSERHRAEAERELLLARATASEARFRRLYDAGVIGVMFWTRDGQVADANDAFLRSFGYARGEVRAGLVRWREMTPPEFAPVDERALAELDRRGVCSPYEKELVTKYGQRVPVLVGAAFAEGSTQEGVAWVLDVTERRRADERRALLVEAGLALLAAEDVSDVLAAATRAAVKSFGTLAVLELLKDDRLGGPYALAHRDPALQSLADELRQRFPPGEGDAIARVARTGRPSLTSGPVGQADDEDYRRLFATFGIKSSLAVPLVARGRVVGVLAVSSAERVYGPEDLAAVEELAPRAGAAIDNARRLAAARAERTRAEEASRAKDEFLAVVSHELRTPLNAILGWTKMARTGALDEERRGRALEAVERNARAQAQLVDDLLDLNRVIAGKLRLNVVPVSLPQVVEAAVDTVRPDAETKGVRLQVVLDPDAGPIVGDPDRLLQVAWNLLSNAVRHTERGGRVLVRLHKTDSHVELTVEDDGEGIAPDFLPHVFEYFRKQDDGAWRRPAALGLGLFIVKHLAELHGGSARAHSEGAGKGATFVVRLPIAPLRSERAAPPPVEVARLDAALGGGFPCPEGLEGLRVLVVDDEQESRDLLASVLGHCKAAVDVAASTNEALGRLAAARYDVLLSDIGMPGEDGYALIRKVRALPPERGGRTPAVALTAFARMEDRTRALLAGFQMHVAKPVDLAELVVVLVSVAGRAGG